MIYRQLNEDYFKDIEIDDDIVNDDAIDKITNQQDTSQYQYYLDFQWDLHIMHNYTKNVDLNKNINVKKVYELISYALEQTQLIGEYYIDNPVISDSWGKFGKFKINDNPLPTEFDLSKYYESFASYVCLSYKVYFNKDSVNKNMSYQRFMKEYMLLQNIMKMVFNNNGYCSISMELFKIDQTNSTKDSSLTGRIYLFPANFSKSAIQLYNELFDNDAPEDDAYENKVSVHKQNNYFAKTIINQTKFDKIIEKSAERFIAQGKYKITPVTYQAATPDTFLYFQYQGKKYFSYVCYDVESLSKDKNINQREFEEDFIKNVIKCLPVQYISEIMLIISFRPVNGTVFDIPEAKLKNDREGKVVLLQCNYMECHIENVEYGISTSNKFYRKYSNKIRTVDFENLRGDIKMIYTDRNGSVFRNIDAVNFYYMEALYNFIKNLLPTVYSKNISKKK